MPDTGLTVSIHPASARLIGGVLTPPLDVTIENEGEHAVSLDSGIEILRLVDGGWHRVGCSGGTQTADAGCDRSQVRWIQLEAGDSLTTASPFPLLLIWAAGAPRVPGTYAAVVAFDDGQETYGAGDEFEISGVDVP